MVTESNALHVRLLPEADQGHGCRGHAAGQVRSRNGLSHRARHVECEAESLSSRRSIDEGLVEGLLEGVIDLRVDIPCERASEPPARCIGGLRQEYVQRVDSSLLELCLVSELLDDLIRVGVIQGLDRRELAEVPGNSIFQYLHNYSFDHLDYIHEVRSFSCFRGASRNIQS